MDPNMLSMIDLARRCAKAGQKGIDEIIESGMTENQVISDMPMIQTNDGTRHKTTHRVSYPSGTWTDVGSYIKSEKSATVQAVDTTGKLQSFSTVPKDLIDLYSDSKVQADKLFEEEQAFGIGFANTMSETIFYGDQVKNPKVYDGIATRYCRLLNPGIKDPLKTLYARNVINGGSTENAVTSIYLVGWGKKSAHGIYPDSNGGAFQRDPLSGFTVETNPDNPNESRLVQKTLYGWQMGLSIRDPRCCARIVNLTVEEVKNGTIDIVAKFLEAKARLFKSYDTVCAYMNEDIKLAFKLNLRKQQGMNFTWETIAGKDIDVFDGVQMRICNCIKLDEAKVV